MNLRGSILVKVGIRAIISALLFFLRDGTGRQQQSP